MARSFFEQVADELVGFLPRDLRGFSTYTSGRNLKVWFGEQTREHYEVQWIPRLAGYRGGVLELGFHAEHADPELNDAVLAAMRPGSWRRALGRDAEAGPFLGRAKMWRRISEVWDGPELLSEESASEAAERLALYVKTLEPLRAASRAAPSPSRVRRPASVAPSRARRDRGSPGRRSETR